MFNKKINQMKNIKNLRMPIESELEPTAGKTNSGYLVGFDQHRGLHILLKDGSVKTFFKDQIKKIISKPTGFPYFENAAVMAIRSSQSQQWNPDLLPEIKTFGQELKFDSGPTKKQLDQLEKDIKKPTKNPPKQKTAQSHWLGMQ